MKNDCSQMNKRKPGPKNKTTKYDYEESPTKRVRRDSRKMASPMSEDDKIEVVEEIVVDADVHQQQDADEDLEIVAEYMADDSENLEKEVKAKFDKAMLDVMNKASRFIQHPPLLKRPRKKVMQYT